MMDNAKKKEIANTICTEISKQFDSKEFLSSVLESVEIPRLEIKKEFWIGNFKISIKVH